MDRFYDGKSCRRIYMSDLQYSMRHGTNVKAYTHPNYGGYSDLTHVTIIHHFAVDLYNLFNEMFPLFNKNLYLDKIGVYYTETSAEAFAHVFMGFIKYALAILVECGPPKDWDHTKLVRAICLSNCDDRFNSSRKGMVAKFFVVMNGLRKPEFNFNGKAGFSRTTDNMKVVDEGGTILISSKIKLNKSDRDRLDAWKIQVEKVAQ